MENQKTQNKIAIEFGLMLGLAGIIVYLLFYFIGMDMESKMPGYITYLVAILIISLGIKSYRDNNLNGHISYGKAVGTGTLISLYAGIISGVFMLIFFKFIAPEMIDKMIELSQQKLGERGLSDTQIEESMKWTRRFLTPLWICLGEFLISVFMGFIFSLIISIFLRKEENPFNSNIG